MQIDISLTGFNIWDIHKQTNNDTEYCNTNQIRAKWFIINYQRSQHHHSNAIKFFPPMIFKTKYEIFETN